MADPSKTLAKPTLAWRPAGTGLNLATHPAGGYRAFFGLACVATVALLAVAAVLVASFIGSGRTPEELAVREQRLQAEQRTLGDLSAAASETVQGERAAEILERTGVLNSLLVRKGVSWTRTFLDLQGVLPPNVRMLSIQPEVATLDTIRLEMAVSAKTPADFIEFLKTLESSDLFRSPALRGSAPPTDGDPSFRYHLTVEYDQQL